MKHLIDKMLQKKNNTSTDRRHKNDLTSILKSYDLPSIHYTQNAFLLSLLTLQNINK